MNVFPVGIVMKLYLVFVKISVIFIIVMEKQQEMFAEDEMVQVMCECGFEAFGDSHMEKVKDLMAHRLNFCKTKGDKP